MLMKLGTHSRNLLGLAAWGLLFCPLANVDAQEIRNYNANFTSTAPTIDGTVSAGEWDAADPAAGNWLELRVPFDDPAAPDTDNNRFRIMWDTNNLYILYETDYDFGWLSNLGGDPDIVFGEENLNLYIDPNRDGDLNTATDGTPIAPGVSNGGNTDGYQFAFNQYEGVSVSSDGDFQGVGFFTEGHVNSPFGDAGGWNEGGSATGGAAMAGSGIVVAQNNTNPSGGVAEMVIPFADLDANQLISGGATADLDGSGLVDGADKLAGDRADPPASNSNWETQFGTDGMPMIETGLNATDGGNRTGPEDGEVWGFNMSQISRDGDNFLPIWNHHDNNSFAPWPHGTLTFIGETPAVSAVPEPALGLLALSGVLVSLARRRR